MVSSTVRDLFDDRVALVNALTAAGNASFLGVNPIESPAQNTSSYLATVEMAETCHLYILILGSRYGFVAPTGKSATELEFDSAYQTDPTKVLIFKKRVKRREKAQTEFVDKVSSYHRGYYIREYTDASELSVVAAESYNQWLQDRAGLGRKLHYFDHFLRLAIQRSPFPGVHPSYLVDDKHIELKYRILGKIHSIHFEKAQIYSDFWGSILELEKQFSSWKEAQYGRGP